MLRKRYFVCFGKLMLNEKKGMKTIERQLQPLGASTISAVNQRLMYNTIQTG